MLDDSSADRDPVEELAEEFLERRRRGETPSLKEYTDRYPDLADEIRDVFPALVMMEEVDPASNDLSRSEAGEQGATESHQIEQLGDYRILREVGRGGMGIVYEAEQLSLGRRVALKVLPQQMLLDKKHKRRFEREAKAAAKLHHTNIVPVFGVGEQDGLHYYVMQFIQGLGLDEVIAELQRMREVSQAGKAPSRGELRVSPRDGDVSAGRVARSLMTGEFERTVVTNHEEAVDERPGRLESTDGDEPQRNRAGAIGPTAPIEVQQSGAGPAEVALESSGLQDASGSKPSDSFTLSGSFSLPGRSDGSSSTSSSRARRKQTFWTSVAHIGQQVASALQYAHEQGITHRDIKPSNLLLDMQGTVWITDFGLAKASDQQDITHTGDILGTLRYMPPEAFEGKSDVRGDQYSLGLTLYELLAPTPAFGEKDRHKLIKLVTTTEPQRIEKLNPDVPRDLATIVHKAIDRDPSHRYASARELADDLQRFLDDEPIKARRISTTERLARWSRRNRGLAAALAALCVLLLVINIAGPVMTWRMAGLNTSLNNHVSRLQRTQDQLEEQRDRANEQAGLMRTLATNEKAAREQADQTLYAADMQLAAQIWRDDEATAAEVRDRLNAHVPADGEKDRRGFEWYYHDYLVNHSATVFRHPVDVLAAAITPDDNLITLDQSLKLRHWDRTTRRENATIDLRQKRHVEKTACSRDGRFVALTGGTTVHLVDTSTGAELRQLAADTTFRELAFSGDGKILVTVNGEGSRIHWWDTSSGEQRAAEGVSRDFSGDLSVSHDGLVVAFVRGSTKSIVSIYRLDPKTNDVICHEKDLFGTRGPGALSLDGKLYATCSFNDGGVTVYETENLKAVTSNSTAHASPPRAMVFSDDGARLITAAADGTVRIWADARNLGESARTLKGHADLVNHLYLSPNGNRLVSSSADDTARVWDLTRPDPAVHTLNEGRRIVWSGEFSPDGLLVAVTDGPDAVLHDAATGARVRVLHSRAGDAYRLAFAPDGAVLAVGYGSTRGEKMVSHILLWDIDSGQSLARLTGVSDIPGFIQDENTGTVGALAFSPDGRYLVAGFGNPNSHDISRIASPIKVWEVATRRLIARLDGHNGSCVSLEFSTDGELLASGSHDGTARIWSTRTWQPLHALENPDPLYKGGYRAFFDTAFSPDGQLLALGSCAGSVVLWDLRAGRHEVLAGSQTGVQAVAFSPNGRTLASASADNTIRLWNMETRRQMLRLRVGDSNALAFSPDGRQLLSAGKVTAIHSALPPLWDEPERATERLQALLEFPVDFQSRVRMLSENLRIHEALQILEREQRVAGAGTSNDGVVVRTGANGSEGPVKADSATAGASSAVLRPATATRVRDIQAAHAAARANWFASRQEWRMASIEFDRLVDFSPDDAADWLRTPGLLRLATALLNEGRPQDAAALLAGAAERRTEDGIDAVVTMVATGDLLHPLLAAINARLQNAPRAAALLELRAELAGQWSGGDEQIADYTAAIESLAESSAEGTVAHLARLYRRRGDAHLALENWQAATDDYARAGQTVDEELLAHQALAEANLLLGITTLVPTSAEQGVTWRLTTREPGEEWAQPGFDTSSWPTDSGPFGRRYLSEASSDLWLRHEFAVQTTETPGPLYLMLLYDDAIDVFLNGQLIAHRQGPTNWRYVLQELDPAVQPSLAPGRNTLAVHCHNTDDSGYVDVGLFATNQRAGSLQRLAAARDIADPWLKLVAANRLFNKQQAVNQLVTEHPQLAGPVGDLFAADEDWEPALAFYSLAITDETTDADLLSRRARAYEQLEDWDAAAADWARAAAGRLEGATLLAAYGKRLAEQGQRPLALDQIAQARQLLERALVEDPGNSMFAAQLTEVLLTDTTDWTVLEPIEMTSAGGATLIRLNDNSVLAGGPNPDHDVYTVTTAATDLQKIRAIRLEALTDDSLPGQGPGRCLPHSGAFVLNQIRVTAASQQNPDSPVQITLDAASADYFDPPLPITPDGRWHIGPGGARKPHVAIFRVGEKVSAPEASSLTFQMTFNNRETTGLQLGRFRLSVTSDLAAFNFYDRRFTIAKIEDPKVRLGAAYALVGDSALADEWFARSLKQTPDFAARRELVERIYQTQIDFAGLVTVHPDDPLLWSALARRQTAAGQADEAAELFTRARSLTEELLARTPADEALVGFLADLLLADTTEWTVLEPIEMTSSGGAALTKLDDDSVLAGGRNVSGDVYRIRTRVGTSEIRAIRLEALPNPSLPSQGPGRHPAGNFHLKSFRVFAPIGEEVEFTDRISIADATASYQWTTPDVDVRGTIDDGDRRYWHVWGRSGVRHVAVFRLATPLRVQPGQPLIVQLANRDAEGGVNLGRFRLSVTDDPAVFDTNVRHFTVLRIADPGERLGAVYTAAGESKQAAQWFARALEGTPGFAARLKLVNRIDELQTDFSDLVAQRPDDPLLLNALAKRQLAGGRAEEAAESLDRARRLTEALLAESPADAAVAGFLADLLLPDPTDWTVLEPIVMTSAGGAKLTRLNDNSVLAGLPNPDHDVYRITAATDLQNITAIRLEALTDDSLPNHGPGRSIGGTFVLDRFKVTGASGAEGDSPADINLDAACADFVSPERPIRPGGEWHTVAPGEGGRSLVAVYRLAEPFRSQEGSRLTFEMTFNHGPNWPRLHIGRFRLSVTDDSSAFDTHDRRFAITRIEEPWARLGAAYAAAGDPAQAAEWFARALEQETGFAARLELVERIDKLQTDLSDLLAQHPDDPPLVWALAKRQSAAGQTDAAAESLGKARRLTEALLAQSPTDEALARFVDDLRLADAQLSISWTVPAPIEMTSSGAATLERQADGSILVTGENPKEDLYTIVLPLPSSNVTALRLETIADERLPHAGSGRSPINGNFQLGEISLSLRPAGDPAAETPLPVTWAHADVAGSEGRVIRLALDGDRKTHWTPYPRQNLKHVAVFQLQLPPTATPEDVQLVVRLDTGTSPWPQHGLGRFRLSVTEEQHETR